MENFSIGDKVSYELSWWGKPRWINNVDRGSSGNWEDGEVIKVRKTHIVVCGQSGESSWPTAGHYRFIDNQWDWPGYIKLVKSIKDGIKCECGAEKCGLTHSDWCPKS